jgi:hypothetical protein
MWHVFDVHEAAILFLDGLVINVKPRHKQFQIFYYQMRPVDFKEQNHTIEDSGALTVFDTDCMRQDVKVFILRHAKEKNKHPLQGTELATVIAMHDSRDTKHRDQIKYVVCSEAKTLHVVL